MAKNLIEEYCNTDAIKFNWQSKLHTIALAQYQSGAWEKQKIMQGMGKESALDDWVGEIKRQTDRYFIDNYPYGKIINHLRKQFTNYSGYLGCRLDSHYELKDLDDQQLQKKLKSHMQKYLKRQNWEPHNLIRIMDHIQ